MIINSKPDIISLYNQPISLEELKFFFIYCPNNSGSTALTQYVGKQLNAYVPPFRCNEGQALTDVKPIFKKESKWGPKLGLDWELIKEKWAAHADGKIFVEGSPSTMMGHETLKKTFGNDSSAIISICDPYMHTSSCMRRYGHSSLSSLTHKWVNVKAPHILRLRDQNPHLPFITYEEFTNNPQVINERLNIPFLGDDIEGKPGSNMKGVKSGYVRSIAYMTLDELRSVNKMLRKHKDIVHSLGYEIKRPKRILREAEASDPEEFAKGVKRRRKADKISNNKSHLS